LNYFSTREVMENVQLRSKIPNLLTLLCVLTLLGMQVLGGVAGYLCRCGGEETVTQTDHCHGPHSQLCHDSQPHQGEGDTHLHDDEGSADRENHEPVQKNIELVQSSNLAAPLLLQVIVAVLPVVSFPSFLKEDTSLRSPLRKGICLQPPALALRKTVALLV